jgi:kallikrein
VLEVCCNTMIVAPAPVPAPKPQKGCGLQNRESFLWSSTLLFKQYPNFVASYKCRVSLVHPKVAVTAAHCLQDKGYYQVRIGGTIRTVARVVVHPSFKQASLQNDVALLVLDKPFKMDKAGVVCVPPPRSLFDGNNCTATTRTSEEDGSLRMIRLPMVSRDECVDLLRKTRLGGYFQLHQSFICAGGGADQDTCGGDGGSPLICTVPGVPGRCQQVGIVSWGIGCGGNLPGVYVNLAHFREWIDEVMIENGLTFFKLIIKRKSCDAIFIISCILIRKIEMKRQLHQLKTHMSRSK